MSSIPANLQYSKDHEWVRVEGDVLSIGITDYAQDSLGEIVYVELPPVGETFGSDEEIANIESVKAASAIYNPISGTVCAVNEDLDGSPDLINSDCYGNFLYQLKDFDSEAVAALMDASQYEAFLRSQE